MAVSPVSTVSAPQVSSVFLYYIFTLNFSAYHYEQFVGFIDKTSLLLSPGKGHVTSLRSMLLHRRKAVEEVTRQDTQLCSVMPTEVDKEKHGWMDGWMDVWNQGAIYKVSHCAPDCAQAQMTCSAIVLQ